MKPRTCAVTPSTNVERQPAITNGIRITENSGDSAFNARSSTSSPLRGFQNHAELSRSNAFPWRKYREADRYLVSSILDVLHG